MLIEKLLFENIDELTQLLKVSPDDRILTLRLHNTGSNPLTAFSISERVFPGSIEYPPDEWTAIADQTTDFTNLDTNSTIVKTHASSTEARDPTSLPPGGWITLVIDTIGYPEIMIRATAAGGTDLSISYAMEV